MCTVRFKEARWVARKVETSCSRPEVEHMSISDLWRVRSGERDSLSGC